MFFGSKSQSSEGGSKGHGSFKLLKVHCQLNSSFCIKTFVFVNSL